MARRATRGLIVFASATVAAALVWGYAIRGQSAPKDYPTNTDIPVAWRLTHDPQELAEAQQRGIGKLRFYGRVVDLSGNFISGAHVVVKPTLVPTREQGTSEKVLTTDEMGVFFTDHLYGESIDLRRIEKQGYMAPIRGYGHDTHHFVLYTANGGRKNYDPDPKEPMVFKLWKKIGHPAPMLNSYIWSPKIRPEQTYEVDLEHKQLLAGGAEAKGTFRLVVDVLPSKDTVAARMKFIAPSDGGFKVMDEGPHPWEAPHEGYETVLELATNAPDQYIYLRTADGRYGFFKYAAHREMPKAEEHMIRISGFLNIDPGDTNLEPDNMIETMDGLVDARKQEKLMREGDKVLPQQVPVGPTLIAEKPRIPSPEEKAKAEVAFRGLFGKVVDQEGQPVPEVALEVRGIVPKERKFGQFLTMTDLEGRFHISDILHGPIYFHRVEKEGYLLGEKFLTEVNVSTRALDGLGTRRDHPVIVSMWKRQEAGQAKALISEQKDLIYIPVDGTPTDVVLIDGPEDGSQRLLIRMNVKRHPDDFRGVRHDWSVGIDVPGGGVVETTDPSLFLAHEDEKYKGSVLWKMRRDGPEFSSAMEKRAYFQAPMGGKMVYGSIDLWAQPSSEDPPYPATVSLKYTVNPMGERTLEPKPGRVFQSYEEYLRFSRENGLSEER